MQAVWRTRMDQLATTGAEPVGKMVIGTVKGDIHDIGKNLVGMMMEGAGFEVIDLGINTDADAYIDALQQHRPDILGMSALLTTTMPYMKVVIDRMREDRDSFDQLYQRALELSRRAFVEGAEEGGETLVVEGASRVLSQPDFSGDVEKLRSLYRAFEEKSKLVQLLDRCLASADVAVFIGAENQIEGMDDCSLVARCLYVGGKPLGTIGVIGPKRMHYDRIIPLVDWTADSLAQFISHGEAR